MRCLVISLGLPRLLQNNCFLRNVQLLADLVPDLEATSTLNHLTSTFDCEMSDKPTLVLNRANVPLRMARKIPFSHGQQEPPYVINVLSFGRFYAAAASDSHIRLYDKATLALSRVIPPVDSASHLTNMTKSQGPDEALIACYADGKVYLYDLKSQSETPVLTLKGGVLVQSVALQRRRQALFGYLCLTRLLGSGPNGAPCLCAATNSNDNYLASGTELFQHEATIRIQ